MNLAHTDIKRHIHLQSLEHRSYSACGMYIAQGAGSWVRQEEKAKTTCEPCLKAPETRLADLKALASSLKPAVEAASADETTARLALSVLLTEILGEPLRPAKGGSEMEAP